MSSIEHLREFVNERLTAAAEEIFGVFKTTIVEYEAEIDRQRKLLDIVWKPEIKLHRIEIPQQHICKEEEVTAEDQDCNSSVDQEEPEIPQIKDEQDEFCTSHNGEQLVLKQETVTFMLTPASEESNHCEPEPKTDHQPLCHNSHGAESRERDQKGGMNEDSGSTRATEPKSKQIKTDSDDVKNLKLLVVSHDTQTGEKRFKCDTCGKAFKQKSTLRRHWRVHTGERPYSCITCGKRFSDASFLKSHMTIHTGEKPYSCKICGKDFRFYSPFKVHQRIHTGERLHTCNTCGRQFYSTSHLKIHIRTHTGEKPYICKTCGRGFTNRSSLRVHERRHTGEKPYPCTTCGKGFCDMPALTKHVRIHTGEKPYTCKICGRAFRRSSGMNRHMQAHTNQKSYFCKTCGKRFRLMPKLKSHMETHSDEVH